MRKRADGIIRFWSFPELHNLELVHGINVRHSFSRHLHRFFCFGVIEEGQRTCFYKGAKYIIPAGNMLIINPGEVHACETLGEKGHTYRILCVPESLLEKLGQEIVCPPPKKLSFPNLLVEDQELVQSFQELCSLLAESESLLEKESCLFFWLTKLVSGQGEYDQLASLPEERGSSIKFIQEYIEDNFAQNLSLECLSALARFSPFHFLRVFSQEVGIPPHIYQNQVRIKKARELLARSVPITQVALETGFVDQSHFTKTFKKLIGVTPGNYLQNILDKEMLSQYNK